MSRFESDVVIVKADTTTPFIDTCFGIGVNRFDVGCTVVLLSTVGDDDGFTVGCDGCKAMLMGTPPWSHSEACTRRKSTAMKNDPKVEKAKRWLDVPREGGRARAEGGEGVEEGPGP